jgi:hypothetical protein
MCVCVYRMRRATDLRLVARLVVDRRRRRLLFIIMSLALLLVRW